MFLPVLIVPKTKDNRFWLEYVENCHVARADSKNCYKAQQVYRSIHIHTDLKAIIKSNFRLCSVVDCESKKPEI